MIQHCHICHKILQVFTNCHTWSYKILSHSHLWPHTVTSCQTGFHLITNYKATSQIVMHALYINIATCSHTSSQIVYQVHQPFSTPLNTIEYDVAIGEGGGSCDACFYHTMFQSLTQRVLGLCFIRCFRLIHSSFFPFILTLNNMEQYNIITDHRGISQWE